MYIRYKTTLLIYLLALPGCNKDDVCRDFPKNLENPIEKIYLIPDSDNLSMPLKSAISKIKSCYSNQSYSIKGYELINRKIKMINNKEYIITYSFDGISDNNIAFRVNENGDVVGVFEYSTL